MFIPNVTRTSTLPPEVKKITEGDAKYEHLTPVYDCEIDYADGKNKEAKATLFFRTFEGTQVGMKLSGFEHEGHALQVSRPESFLDSKKFMDRVQQEIAGAGGSPDVSAWNSDPDALFPLLGDLSMSVFKLWGVPDPTAQTRTESAKLTFHDVPLNLEESRIRDLFAQFGSLKFLKLYDDCARGLSRGYGIAEFENSAQQTAEAACEIALHALNGFVLGDRALKVRPIGQTAAIVGKLNLPQSSNQDTITAKLFKMNPMVTARIQHSRKVGLQPSRVVQLLNAVYESDLLDGQDVVSIENAVREEAGRCGSVESVKIPVPTGRAHQGVGKIFVMFADTTSARRFQSDTNGRKFDGKVVCAAFFPQDRFMQEKYSLAE